MRKIRLSDTDVELFDIEISPSEYTFYQRHKDAFRTMWREQGKPFWTRYVISFRSFTVKHGVIKQMNVDSPKFHNLIDQAFIFIHEQFVDGKETTAKNFLEDIAKLAQNQDKFPALDSKSFARDPFYLRETRELFRSFFGMPDQKSSYLKVYILCPVFMRFGGSVCRCLEKWLTAEIQEDPNDDSYWTPLTPQIRDKCEEKCAIDHCPHDIIMCEKCIEDCKEKYFNESTLGDPNGPKFLSFWKLGDPRFKDSENPLFAPHVDPRKDWRDALTEDLFKEFFYYAKCKYGDPKDKCSSCVELREYKDELLKVAGTNCHIKKNKNNREVDLTQMEEFHTLREKLKKYNIDKFEDLDVEHCCRDDALNVSARLMQYVEEHKNELFGDSEEKQQQQERQKQKRQEKKKRRKARARAAKKDNSPVKETPSSPERVDQVDSDDEDDDDDNGDAIGAFKIMRDEKKGIVTVTVTTSKENRKNGAESKLSSLPKGVTLCIDLIREQITGLPKLFEFWKGAGFLIAVLNYEEEEKSECEKPTNFTVKVAGVNNKIHENIIVKLLFYVQKRKKRKSLGWTMEADDVVACILPDDEPLLAGLEVTIIRGNFFKAKLSKKERQTLEESVPLKKVLMMIEPNIAKEIRDSSSGKDRLMNIISTVCTNNTMREKRQHFNDLWTRLLESPTKFNFIMSCNSTRVEELKKIGLTPLDLNYEDFMAANCPSVAVCRNCFKLQTECSCSPSRRHLGSSAGDIKNNNPSRGEQIWVLKNDCDGPDHKPLGDLVVEAQRALKAPELDPKLKGVMKDIEEQVKRESPDGKATFERVITGIGKYLTKEKGGNDTVISQLLSDETVHKELKALYEDHDESLVRGRLKELIEKPETFQPIKPKKVNSEAPRSPFKKPVTAVMGNLQVSFTKGSKEPTFDLKLETVDGRTPITFDKDGWNEALDLKSADIIDYLKDAGIQFCDHEPDETGYCHRHHPSEVTTPARQSSLSKKGKHKPAIAIGVLKRLPTSEESDSKSDELSKEGAAPMPSKSVTEKMSPLKKEDNAFKPNKIAVDMEKLCLVSTANENKGNAEKKTSNEKGSSPANETGSNKEEEKDDRSMSLKAASHFLASAAKEINKGEEKSKKTDVEAEQADEMKETGTEKLREENMEADKMALKHCGHCGKEEPRRKAFKKCQKCKEEGVRDVRYYCGRDCQVEDWRLKHKGEHRDKLLG